MTSLFPAPHRPVLVEETLTYLAPRPGGAYCDATLGAGGHAEQILERSAPSGRLFGIDRDATALSLASARLARFGDRFIPMHGPFADAARLLTAHGAPPLDGLLADLGVSSMQLDQVARGFSWQSRGPIDMRMDQSTGETALDLIDRLDEETLANIIFEYGEERFSRRIARALKQASPEDLTDTFALAELVARAVPRREPGKNPATRTFQALRIAVNDELRQVHTLLGAAPHLLKPGGRLVVISFHSLEDRLVKQHLQRGLPGEDPSAPPTRLFSPLHKKPILPSDDEVAGNPRARSARLRAASVVDANAALTRSHDSHDSHDSDESEDSEGLSWQP